MKRTIITLAFIVYIFQLHGQNKQTERWSDISTFMVYRFNPTLNKPLIWFSHEEGTYFLESRMNFDWRETGAILIGKTIKKNEHLWVTPKIGILIGLNTIGYDGASLETNLGGTYKHFRYFAMNQLAISVNKNPSFLYNFSQLGYRIKNVQINYSAQFYHPINTNDIWIDHGPQITYFYKKIWFKPWYTWDTKHKITKLIVGIGYHF